MENSINLYGFSTVLLGFLVDPLGQLKWESLVLLILSKSFVTVTDPLASHTGDSPLNITLPSSQLISVPFHSRQKCFCRYTFFKILLASCEIHGGIMPSLEGLTHLSLIIISHSCTMYILHIHIMYMFYVYQYILCYDDGWLSLHVIHNYGMLSWKT